MAIFDNGKAPITTSVKKDEANVPMSAFNMSRVKYMNGLFGALMPFDVLETLPGEKYKIGYDVLAELRNPTVRKMLNGMKIFIHTYWCPKKDLWRGFKNYIDKGRSGTVELEVPKLCTATKLTDPNALTQFKPSVSDDNTLVPFAPSSFMGLPFTAGYDLCNQKNQNKNMWYRICQEKRGTGESAIEKVVTPHIKAGVMWEINAMPFVMYCKIYRDYYANKNILGSNREWFHEDEDEDLIIPYNPNTVKNYINTANGELIAGYTNSNGNSHVPEGHVEGLTDVPPMLNVLYSRQYRGDYFTTANIFADLLRGDRSQLNMDLDLDIDVNVAFDNISFTTDAIIGATSESYTPTLKVAKVTQPVPTDTVALETSGGIEGQSTIFNNALKKALNNAINTSATVGTGTFTLNQLRKAVVLEKMMMRNATTDGSYRELIGIQFGHYPSDHTRKPVYIGGTEYNVNFNTVTATNFDATTNNLGQKTSEGYASGTGYIGNFTADDYGYIMSIMSIVPDVYYAKQGIDPMWQRTTQDKEYFPILNNLEPMAIKNKELFLSSDNDYNEDVWGYADRYEDMKSRRNEVTGLAMSGSTFDRAQFMLREFSDESKPQLTQAFLTMLPERVDMTPFTSANEPPFDITVGCNIEKVSPMPYKSEPADMGIKY